MLFIEENNYSLTSEGGGEVTGQNDVSGMMGTGENTSGPFESPGGFVFGVTGWNWGEQRPKSITFFLDGSAKVCDQHGRPIRGVVKDGQPVYFEKCGHAAVVAALTDEKVDWQSLVWAGWPQLKYEDLKGIKNLPPTPEDELKKIANTQLRRDALRIRREVDESREKEMRAPDEE